MTLSVMARLAREGSQEERLPRLLRSISGKVNAPALWDAMIRSVFRFRDEWNEVVRSVPEMLDHLEADGTIEGDCDCISVFLAAGMKALGYECRFVATRTEEDNPEFLHVFTEAFYGGDWIPFDPTVPRSVVDSEVDFERLYQKV